MTIQKVLTEDVKASPVPPEIEKLAFDDYTLETARAIINARNSSSATKALLFYNGDHWQGGDAWIGPRYDEEHTLFEETTQAIEKTMVSHNVTAEMVDRHVDGVLGREIHWKFVVKAPLPKVEEADPNTGETILKEGQPDPRLQALIDEAQLVMDEWWRKRNILEVFKNALAGLLCIKRAPLRFSIPPAFRDKSGKIPQKELEEAIDYLYLDHMGWDDDIQEQVFPSATVWINKNSRQPIGVFLYKDGDQEKAELTYVDALGNTVLKVLGKDGDLDGGTLSLGQRILMYEMNRKALITPQIMSQQKSLNKTLSMKDRNDTQGGYLERFLVNIKWPTKKVKDKEGNEVEVPDTMYGGPGTANAVQGTVFEDSTGKVHVQTPSVQFRDPVSAKTFIESADHTYLGMLQEGKQLHHAATDMAVSGESRKQSRESYVKDLQASANVVEGAVRWVLETGLTEAAILAGRAGAFDELRAYAQCKVDPGPVSPDDMRVAAEMKERGLWDLETAISATGADDVDSIIQRMAVERAADEARAIAFQEQQIGLDEDNSGDNPTEEGASGDNPQAPGQGEQAQSKPLSGIQIRSATEIIDRVESDSLSPEKAVQLLVALGFAEEQAQALVKKAA